MDEINTSKFIDDLGMKRITNNTLVCRDCSKKLSDDKIFGNTSKCEEYPQKKPNSILLGGECDKYVKE